MSRAAVQSWLADPNRALAPPLDVRCWVHGHRSCSEPVAYARPWSLVRGLIHSDGCRALNRVVVRGKAYEYQRYFFSNESRDILRIMGSTLDRVGVAWRYNRPNCLSIARRAAVAAMDAHVGPKT